MDYDWTYSVHRVCRLRGMYKPVQTSTKLVPVCSLIPEHLKTYLKDYAKNTDRTYAIVVLRALEDFARKISKV